MSGIAKISSGVMAGWSLVFGCVVEKEVTATDVLGKREAALRWVNHGSGWHAAALPPSLRVALVASAAASQF